MMDKEKFLRKERGRISNGGAKYVKARIQRGGVVGKRTLFCYVIEARDGGMMREGGRSEKRQIPEKRKEKEGNSERCLICRLSVFWVRGRR